jgi:hypothetical protein
MAQDNRTGSEDNSQNVRATQNAADNRDALAEEARRVAATAPDSVNHPVDDTGRASTGANQGGTTGGASGGASGNSGGTMHASEDASEAREHVREAAENRDALAEEARRVQDSAPADIDRGPR